METFNAYYQNTRGLRTKADTFLPNVVSSNFNIICLTETWLNEEISSADYFPPSYTVHRRDRDYALTRQKFGGGVLIAVNQSVTSHRRQDLETYPECVWIELLSNDGCNYLIGNYYFPPLSDNRIFNEHFDTLEKEIDFSKFRVHIYGDFNLPGANWQSGFVTSQNSITASKSSHLLNFIHFNGLSQLNGFDNSAGNVLDLFLSNVPIIGLTLADVSLVKVDAFHPPFIVAFHNSLKSAALPKQTYYSFNTGDYFGLYRFFENYDWSSILKDDSVDSAAKSFTTVVRNGMENFIPKRSSKPRKYPSWYSKDLIYYIKKKSHCHKLYKKKKKWIANVVC